MPVTKLYTFNLTCVILLVALYGVALNGIVYSTRIYNRGLSNDEILANHATDEQNY